MTEDNTDFQKGIDLQRDILQQQRNKFYQNFMENGIDLAHLEELSDIFESGIKDGSVKFKPNKDGSGSLFINTNISGEEETRELTIDNKDEAAFFLGLQDLLNPPEKK